MRLSKRSTGMRKAERARFLRLMKAYLGPLKLVRNFPNTHRDMEIDTPVGPLGISVGESGNICHVHCAFEYARVAAKVMGTEIVNQHSGKWNFYYGKGWTAQAALDDFKASLEQVLGVTWDVPARTRPQGWDLSIRIP